MLTGEFGPAGPIIVLTAIGLEYEAVRAHLVDPRRVIHEGTWFEAGEVTGSGHQVVLAEVGPGNRATAAFAERARARFAPRAIIFVGVAGSLKPDVRLGDVVVADKIYAYDGSKQASDAEFARPAAWEPSHGLLQAAKHSLRGTAWTERVRAGAFQPDRLPEVHVKPVAAGETVLNSMNSPLRERLTNVFNDAVAVEMESAGLATAAVLGKVDVLTIRGISDCADGAKASADARGSQQIAAAHAAAAAMAVIAALPGDDDISGATGQEPGPADDAPALAQGPRQVNRADRKGVVNAVQNGNQTINYGPQVTDR
ncbi:5'-methylthioadenosine/S-adenosylhomocysteine nucleosidase [Streptomyces griseoviridis]|uniref:5'-methylthioadenosine/S-adenosylhomocysteine nucleosidase family protein n=1 Tax=Streptomyces TaxID=1883 RepID=UPI000FBB1199|nr:MULTISPECIES: 5'-methylthioadenosine/S-adenosylhomocysteine nucleosidase [unclassified Streptomyces]MDH6696827.1 adenosylhomocysteine nucleosidase [Streptomyces sp. MAA16]NED89969.1 5'-methylthioadenosine/S-adenosylhomocysteine nucleosidase [Streptomyces sp. SID11233]ROQ62664.1 nucleoside phosphorylase [Streptomyces sp. 840.1]